MRNMNKQSVYCWFHPKMTLNVRQKASVQRYAPWANQIILRDPGK